MASSADEWFIAGRPTHPDFLVISDIILSADAASAEGGFEDYIRRFSSLSLPELSKIAMDESATLRKTYPDAPLRALGEAMWAMGFAAGVRVSRNEKPPTREEAERNPEAVAYAGVDADSVRYAARQRVMRLVGNVSLPTRDRITLAGCWLDAVMVGLRFDERRSAFAPD